MLRLKIQTFNDKHVNIQEHLAAKEAGVSLRSWWRPKQSQDLQVYWDRFYACEPLFYDVVRRDFYTVSKYSFEQV